MTKITKAQENVLNRAKERIDFARSHNFYDWYMRRATNYERINIHNLDELDKHLSNRYGRDLRQAYINDYENERKGITIVLSNTRTIKALERLGLIRIINEGGSSIDTIEVIGY